MLVYITGKHKQNIQGKAYSSAHPPTVLSPQNITWQNKFMKSVAITKIYIQVYNSEQLLTKTSQYDAFKAILHILPLSSVI